MLDDALAEVLPPRVRFRVAGVRGGGEDVGGAEVRAEALGDDRPAHEFGDGEEFQQLGFVGNLGVAGVGVDAVQEVGLLVVVRGEEDVVDDALEDSVELGWVVFDGGGVEDLAVVFAGVEVVVIVLGEGDLLFVVAEFEVGDVVGFFEGRVVGCAVFLFVFPLFLVGFDLLRRLSGFAGEVACADFAAQDAGLCPVALFNAEGDLLKDEFGLFAPFHGAKGFDLKFAEDVGGGVEVALGFFHV